MGEIITGKDIAPLITPQVGGMSPANSDIGNLVNDLKGLKELADTVDSILSKIVTMRGKGATKETQGFTGQAPAQAPAQIQSNSAPQVIEREKVIYKMRPINPAKIKQLLSELIFNEAPAKLPQEIKDKKVDEMIGENFKTFTFKYKDVIEINSEIILDTIAQELSKMLQQIQEQEERENASQN